MKNQLTLLSSMLLVIILSSCDPVRDIFNPTSEDSGPSVGAVTAIGTSEGAAITKSIGAAGGTIASADERLTVTIPPGALSTTQTISVQPLSNQCPAGTGEAFRLAPHGITFAKPVSVRFRYQDADLNVSTHAALKIAFQNDKGVWQARAISELDTTARTIDVQTDHFSDWALFQNMFIQPQNPFLNPGEDVQLQVFQLLKPESSKDGLFVPLPKLILPKYIEKWTLRGEGIIKPNQNIADYHAPSQIPAMNPATVTVQLNISEVINGHVFKDLRLVTNIFVAPVGVSVKIDEGGWETYTGGATINGTQNVILGSNGNEFVTIGWIGTSTGRFNWTKSAEVAFNLIKSDLFYQHLYGKGPSLSNGSLVVNSLDQKWVTGTFTLQPAGWINTSVIPAKAGTAGVTGVFRLETLN